MHHQTSSKLTWPGDDAAEFSGQNSEKVDFLREETSKGKVLTFPTLMSHSSFQTGLESVGEPEGVAASCHWRAVWNPETKRDPICWAFFFFFKPETVSQLASVDHLEIHPQEDSDDK